MRCAECRHAGGAAAAIQEPGEGGAAVGGGDWRRFQRGPAAAVADCARACCAACAPTQEALPHCGLGLPGYVQITSPIRRYTDLLAHWQIKVLLRPAVLTSLLIVVNPCYYVMCDKPAHWPSPVKLRLLARAESRLKRWE